MAKRDLFTFLLTALFLFSLSSRTTAQPVQPAPQPPALTLTVHTIAPSCNASNGAVFLTATGGTSPYTFFFKGINTGSNGTLSGLGVSTFPVAVTDAAGATASQTVTLTQTINPPTVSVSAYSNPTGCGKTDGMLTLTATGGTPPYTFTDDYVNWQSSGVFTNLPPDMLLFDAFNLNVRDANGCMAFPINPPLLVSNCPMSIWSYDYNSLLFGCGIATSYIHINGVSGGTPPYTYSLDGVNYQSSGNFDNLPAGFYRVYVQDATGLSIVQVFTISDECALTATYVETDASCAHNDGTITVTAKNGAPGYLYSLDGLNYQMSNQFTGLTAGAYRVIVRDLYGSTFPLLVTVFDNCPIVTALITNENCGNGKGSITADGSNGTAPYQYSIDGTNYQVSPLFPNLSTGNYTIYIKDARGLLNNTSAAVGNTCVQLLATPASSTCGKSNGTITAAASNGAIPYQYSIDGTHFQSNPLFDQLPAGNYTVTVKDANGAQATAAVIITDIAGPQASLTIAPSSCNAPDGSILVNAIGGTSPFAYSIDGINFNNSNLFASIGSGTVLTATIKDANGCTVSQNVTMTSKPAPQLAAIATPATCLNNDGSIVASNIGGSGPFQYSLDGANYQSDGQFTALPISSQVVYIKDANGCTASQPITVPLNDNLSVDPGLDKTICEGQRVTFTAQSNGLTFSWSPATGLSNPSILDPVASPQSTTQYTLTASTSVCSGSKPVTVNVNPAPVADAGKDDTVCFGGSVQLQGNGGQCSWSPPTWLDDPHSSTPMVMSPTKTITYQLTVTDANGCSSLQPAQVTVTVTPPAKVFAGNDTSVLTGQPIQLNAADLDNSGFNSYTWSPAGGLNNAFVQDPIAYPTENTVYTVTASTATGCTGTASIAIKVYAVSGIFVPSGFTPNGDGHNDLLKAIPIGIREFKYFVVYNRWGQRVFQTVDPNKGWDGTLNGQLQSSGTFVWTAAGTDYKGAVVQRQGTVILIR